MWKAVPKWTYSYCAFNMWYCFTIYFFSLMPSHLTKISCCSSWCWILLRLPLQAWTEPRTWTIQTSFHFSREQDNTHWRLSDKNMVEPLFASPVCGERSRLLPKSHAHIQESLRNLVSNLRRSSLQRHQLAIHRKDSGLQVPLTAQRQMSHTSL